MSVFTQSVEGTATRGRVSDRVRLLFVVEGYTDIRFVTILSEVSELTLLTPREHFQRSGLGERLEALKLPVKVAEIPGSRLAYQAACTRYLWNNARRFDVILGQEMLRGSLSATLIGRLRGVPVVTYMCLPSAEYFRCRRLRKQISWPVAFLGDRIIASLMTVTGKLSQGCIALGPYLETVARKYCRNVTPGFYYGVDTKLFSPCTAEQKASLRRKLDLPANKFLILFSSRVSHEKDPETVLRAASLARQQGLDCTVLNLAGGYKDFVDLAESLGMADAPGAIIARPPAHPMQDLPDYYRASDCLAQGSLEEGLGMSPLEALACGVPAVCSAVGGLKANLEGHARLVPVRDPEAMAREFVSIHRHRDLARQEALAGRRFVEQVWSRERAVESLSQSLGDAARARGARTRLAS